jgi:hypothetical protein
VSVGDAPVVPGRLYGLRCWRAGQGRRLEAPFTRQTWQAGASPTRARCTAGSGHHSPASRCGCGLYALHPTAVQCQASFGAIQRAAAASVHDAEIVGIVAAWGEVELHESGFRAEYARPHVLLLPAGSRNGSYAELVRAIGARHDAEVWEVRSARDLERRCVNGNLGLSNAAVNELLGPKLRRSAAVERTRSRIRRFGETAAEVAGMALGLLFSGLVPLLFVVALLVGDDASERSAAPRISSVTVLDQALVEVDGSDLYVALVRNPSDSRSALRICPKGEFLDDLGEPVTWPDDPAGVDNRPSLAPGQLGVVYDWLDSYESVADQVEQINVRVVARRWADRPRRSPLGVSRVNVERPRCLATATVRSARRRLEAELAVIGRDRRGHIVGAGSSIVGPLPRGRSRQVLERIHPRPCVRDRLRFEAYPNLSASDLAQNRTGT